ncbi:MAG TPA: hypothetical protein VL084_02835 [Thermoanaerobaculia bacterium]|nr:hypothetical protein [Thermoanaerobaculia bacterium]
MRRLSALAVVLMAGTAFAQEPTPEPSSSAAVTAPDLSATPAPETRAAPAVPPPSARPIGTGGSSLADIARRQKEQREREGKKASLGVISNETLRKSGAAADAAAAKGGAKAKATPTPVSRPVPASAPAPAPATIPEWRDLKGRTEADWRQLIAGVRDRVAAAEGRVKALESDAKRYENDFYAWSDGNYRDRVIRPAWDQARTDLANARNELESARAQLADLEEDARKSSAPPGWLR